MKRIIGVACSLLLLASSALAYKPAPPRKTVSYQDQSKTVTLTFTSSSWSVKSVTLTAGKKSHSWAGKYEMPHSVFIAKKAGKVLFLGGYGNGCLALGEVKIYDFSGKLLKTLALKSSIADLKKISRAYTRICCPCRWVAGVTESAKGDSVTINVCKKKSVTISLSGLNVSGVTALP